MKTYCIILWIASSLIVGCTLISKTPLNLSTEGCSNAPELYWGKRGQNPSDNDVWRCYDWVLIKQKDF